MKVPRRDVLSAGLAGLVAGALSGAVAGLLPFAAPARAEEAIGRVERLDGSVYRRRDGAMTALRSGDLVYSADELVTRQGARLQIRLSEGSLLVLGGGTSLRLADVALPTTEASGSGLVVMGDGILRMILQGGGAWEGFSVEGSTSVASVRGTDFVVESAAEVSSVFVVGGLVEVTGKAGGSARLSAGQGTTTSLGEPVQRAKRWGAARVAETMAKVQVLP